LIVAARHREETINMADTNAGLLRRAYDAFAQGDVPTVLETFSDEITWHVPGRSPLSGDYKGHSEVVGFFGTTMELSAGTFRVVVDEILAHGERVVALTTVSAERNGRRWSSPEVHVWQVVNGKAVEFREFQGDQQAEDEFWSS
jgi:ketosteroid isomerase-like protein